MIPVIFNIENNDFFNGNLSILTTWNFPHLPRIGEIVHPLLLISHKSFNWENAYSILKDEWKKDFEDYFANYGNGDKEQSFKSWLWDCMCEFNTISYIQYSPTKNSLEVLPIITLK